LTQAFAGLFEVMGSGLDC